ncbi:hypothetical protein BO98_01040 [Candidatus Synechococcus spongiarum LMB bulk10D]|nr:hypothetical protein BO98_01040 [Candidatus Synechococcus spongiarum LMB bulk10D]
MAIREDAAVKLEFLATNYGKLLGNTSHGTVESRKQPAMLVLTRLIVRHISFLTAQFHKAL